MPFFDLHLHPTLKSLFSDAPAKLSPWQKIDTRKIPPLLRCCSEFEYILQTQSALSQLIYNECKIVCVALYSPERAMLDNDLLLGNADGPLGVYLNSEKIKKIINSTLEPYDLLKNDDLQTLLHPEMFGVTDRKVVPLWKESDYKGDDKTLYVVFSVEGCHSLSSALNKFDVSEIIENLDDLRKTVPLVSLNITHLEQSALCNHAFGIQYISGDAFKPTGNGIAPDGVTILKHCYENNIMVDIKHMSLGSRKQLYALRNTPEFKNINQPVICTHAGFTGISFNDIPDYILTSRNFPAKKFAFVSQGKPVLYGAAPRPSFNASSINLYNDDIMQVLNSGGIIGLSLDKRILGFHEATGEILEREVYATEVEYISLQETEHFFTKQITGEAFVNEDCIEWAEVIDGQGPVAFGNPKITDYHLQHFMAHILHFYVVVQTNAYDIDKAFTQICIGSDYDGIINPVWICDTVDELIYFKNSFEKEFVRFAKDCGVGLPQNFDINKFADQLFFENGKNFIFERLSKIQQPV